MKKKIKIGLIVATAIFPVSNVIMSTSCSGHDEIDNAVHILNINDFHGAAVGYGDDAYPLSVSSKNPGIERLANTYNDFLETHPNSIFLAAGDNNSGDSFSTATHGETLYPLLKAMGVRYSALGNHAFDWGIEYLTGEGGHDTFDGWARTDLTEGSYFVASNILNDDNHDTYEEKKDWVYDETEAGFENDFNTWNDNRVTWVDPYKIIDIGGHSICLIGLTTQKTRQDGNSIATKNVSFIDYIASINYAKHLAKISDEQRYNSIESFILLTHVESDFVNEEVTGAAADIARQTNTDIDAIISGHSHKEGFGTVYNFKLNKNIWVGQANTAGRAILDTRLDFGLSTEVQKRETKSVSMAIIHPALNSLVFEFAQKQLEDIRKKAFKLPKNNVLHSTCEEFEKREAEIREKFIEPVGHAKTQGEKYPWCNEKGQLGHTYTWPSDYPTPHPPANYVDEQMGAWINMAIMKGFVELTPHGEEDYYYPSVAFISFDSITHEFVVPEGQTEKPITVGDIYQLQTYENNLSWGFLSLGQLCNIIDYMLAGEGVFNYEDNPQYELKDELVINPITGEKFREDMPELKSAKYLCGPLQFWGMKFEVEEEKSSTYKKFRKWHLAYDWDGQLNKKIPRLWIYIPSLTKKTNGTGDQPDSVLDPDSWTSARELIEKGHDYIQVITNSFIFNGGNDQSTMFKYYMELNAEENANDHPYHIFPENTRDAIMAYCKTVAEGEYVDIPEELAHNVVVFPQS